MSLHQPAALTYATQTQLPRRCYLTWTGTGGCGSWTPGPRKRPVCVQVMLSCNSTSPVSRRLRPLDVRQDVEMSGNTAGEIVDTLIHLHFFRFTATEDLNRAIENVRRNFLRRRKLDSTDERWCRSKDSTGQWIIRLHGMERRIYSADAEDLAEGGVCDTIREMMPVLALEGIHIASCEDEGLYDEETQIGTYNVVLNGHRYPILDTRMEGHGWGAAHRRTIEITNDLLQDAGSDERLFGQASGNDAASSPDGRTFPLHQDTSP